MSVGAICSDKADHHLSLSPEYSSGCVRRHSNCRELVGLSQPTCTISTVWKEANICKGYADLLHRYVLPAWLEGGSLWRSQLKNEKRPSIWNLRSKSCTSNKPPNWPLNFCSSLKMKSSGNETLWSGCSHHTWCCFHCSATSTQQGSIGVAIWPGCSQLPRAQQPSLLTCNASAEGVSIRTAASAPCPSLPPGLSGTHSKGI